MEEQYVKEIPLENDLHVHIYDASRRLAGDRWLVKLITRIHFKVDDVWDEGDTNLPTKSAVRQLLGSELVFEQNQTRHFIDEKEKEAVFQDMVDNFLTHSVPYLSHPEFAGRYIRKIYQEKQKQKLYT